MNSDHAKRVLAHQERQQQMLISAAFPSKYLKAADLSGEATPVTITTVKLEQVQRNGDPQPVIYFKEFQQGMVLNKTNGKAIAKLFGDDTNRWKGNRIELFEAMVEFQGDVMPALRVRAVKEPISAHAAEMAEWDATKPKLSEAAVNRIKKPKVPFEKAPWEESLTNPAGGDNELA